jgi:hypothetical protein
MIYENFYLFFWASRFFFFGEVLEGAANLMVDFGGIVVLR